MYLLKKWWKEIFRYPQTKLGASYWDARGRAEGGRLSAWQKARADIVLAKIGSAQNVTITDIGSGEGEVLEYLATNVPGLVGIGVDADQRVLERVAARGFTPQQQDLSDTERYESLPQCDYALLFEIIEHIPEAEQLVAAVRKKASRGVFISVPNTGFFTYRLRLLFGKVPAQWAVRPNEHVRFWTLTDMRWWLAAQDIMAAQIITYEGVPLLKHLIPNWFAAGMVVYIP
jgi:2-polyprenyl-3-methyl-5-hydroxy-6-metoxy-1,4-benzoquinol methylase